MVVFFFSSFLFSSFPRSFALPLRAPLSLLCLCSSLMSASSPFDHRSGTLVQNEHQQFKSSSPPHTAWRRSSGSQARSLSAVNRPAEPVQDLPRIRGSERVARWLDVVGRDILALVQHALFFSFLLPFFLPSFSFLFSSSFLLVSCSFPSFFFSFSPWSGAGSPSRYPGVPDRRTDGRTNGRLSRLDRTGFSKTIMNQLSDVLFLHRDRIIIIVVIILDLPCKKRL